jgi:excisionase family DNA binding protein
MESAKKAASGLRPRTPSHPGVPQPAAEEEVYALLLYLKVAVDDNRQRLAANRKDHYTVVEIAVMVGLSCYSVRRWISERRIKAIRIEGTGPKGRLLVPREALEVLVRAGMGAAIPDAMVS